MPRRMASLRDGKVPWIASSKRCSRLFGTGNFIFDSMLVCLFFMPSLSFK